MTSHRIGVNLRVSGNCDQGARKYMEDNHVIKFLKKDTEDYEFAYFGIFDGHGGPEASAFCKDNLLNEITKFPGFWSDDDEQVLQAIRKGFLDTHNAMWNVIDTWPKTPTGLPSTAGSTATIAIIKQGKLYTGHVGDSGLVLGENDAYSGDDFPYQAVCITKEHKPDDPDERLRIEDAGGEVINKSGVPRVVWSRPKVNHKGPVRRSTQIDQIPFLAVARSLGDLWSYDYYTETYVVSPDPDVTVMKLDPSKHRCIILASDGLWNMLTPEETVNIVMDLECQFEQKIISDPNVAVSFWSNPAEHLVSRALNKWRAKSLKADNTSCVVVLIDPLGPSKLTLLKRKRQALLSAGEIMTSLHTKLPHLGTEIDHRSKAQNRNANCSLSDSHIRVNDDSILKPPEVERDHLVMPSGPRRSFCGYSKPDLPAAHEDTFDESIQYFPRHSVKWNTRPPVGEDRNQSMSSLSFRIGGHSTGQAIPASNSSTCVASLAKPSFTKLADNGRNNGEPVGGGDSDSDYERMLPKPPPSTPSTCLQEVNRSKVTEKEDSLHSSADITDKAFTLASDESISSPESSFGKDDRPPTPQSAPAKLSTRRGVSKRAKKKLAKSGKMLHDLSQLTGQAKPPIRINGTVFGVSADTLASQSLCLEQVSGCDISKLVNAVPISTSVSGKTSVPIKTSPLRNQRQVLNTSRSMNNVATPKNQKAAAARSTSCSGLTPEMSLLMSQVPKSYYSTLGMSTTNSDITAQLFSALLAAGLADSKTVADLNRIKVENSINVDETLVSATSGLLQTEPLKQLNKTVSVQKTGSKRWGNFLRASKNGIDQVFHLGHHRKNPGGEGKKLASTSTSTLDCNSTKMTMNTSVSTSKMADNTILNHHLPDVTVSHLADISFNASAVTAGDLTNLSANDSILSADGLAAIHHSMLDPGVSTKGGKKRKSLIQKTRVTLRRARQAAKKAFFPENHRLFHKPSTNKRRSDEFLPTPELKRRRQLESEKVKIH